MIDLGSKVFKHKASLRCKGCRHILKEYTYEKEEDIMDSSSWGDTESRTLILKCPKCDKNWEKNCGVDFKVYPHIREAVLQNT